jgi:hypothetical protein
MKEDNLGQILSKLAQKNLQVKLTVGFKDSCGGYGWSPHFYVTIYKTIEYCFNCRKNYNVNYKDDYEYHHSHKHEYEQKCIFTDLFFDAESLCLQLNKILNDDL